MSDADSATGDDGATDTALDADESTEAASDATTVDASDGAFAEAGTEASTVDSGAEAGCATGTKSCAGSCVSATDPAHGCGATDCTPCSFAHASATCAAGACALGACDPLWGDCDGDPSNGCETDETSVNTCGSCTATCSFSSSLSVLKAECAGGVCGIGQCFAYTGDCNHDPKDGCETSTLDDPKNCDECGYACGAWDGCAPVCMNAKCLTTVCPAGQVRCDCNPYAAGSTAGCTTLTTLTACGACGKSCLPANGTGDCSTGTCEVASCYPYYGDCDHDATNGCETRITDANNCGACGIKCAVACAGTACAGTWSAMSIVGAPAARRLPSAVWSGTEMIVWGGEDGPSTAFVLGDGARYNPTTDSWTSMSAGTNSPSARAGHVAAWTGTEMLIWGGAGSSGLAYDGALYNPKTDSWRRMSTVGAPSPRVLTNLGTHLWTGTQLVVWGGSDSSGWPTTGAVYTPATDTWSTIATTGAPAGREFFNAAWTGSKLLVYGGSRGTTYEPTSALYDPVANTWSALPSGPEITFFSGEWTGTTYVAAGVATHSAAGPFFDGSIFDSATGAWSDLPSSFDRTSVSTSVWTGKQVIVWGGCYDYNLSTTLCTTAENKGRLFNPSTGTWNTITAPLSGRWNHVAVWTGSLMLVWGGRDAKTIFGDGAKYLPEP
ncbi:MAG: hypothetical protein ACHREM_05005 [Polyangiales bacterium]